ncbi:MAG: choice-of-anchor J domain-containing protein, partial [Bacteroidales bacterium]|nr:choice-of-anchor J domain-containing protein [Bacteroidales bacterium]
MRIHISILTFLALCLMLFTGPFVSFGQGNNLSPVRESLTVVFHEGFDDAVFPPPLWTVTDFGLSDYGWEHATWTFHIGGGSAYGNWDLDEINTWLISPPIVLEPDLQYHLEFFQRNYNFGAGGNSVVMVSTGSNQAGSSDFVEVYQMNEAFPVFTETSINLSGFSGNEIYLAFVHHGTNAHEWVIDEVTVREIANADAGIIGLISPTALIEPGNYEVIVEMENFGSVIITSLDIVCEIDDFVETFTWDGALYPGESTHVSIISSFDFSSSGLHSITVTTLLEDDGNPENDSFSTEVISGESCGYTVYMTSLTGNGFHGASIGFIQSGVITASFGAQFTEGSAFGPLNLVIADGYPTQLIALTAGDFSSSLGFTVIDPQGDTIHHRSFGSAFSAGDLFEFFQSDCNLLE